MDLIVAPPWTWSVVARVVHATGDPPSGPDARIHGGWSSPVASLRVYAVKQFSRSMPLPCRGPSWTWSPVARFLRAPSDPPRLLVRRP